jgi:hypothetical protein
MKTRRVWRAVWFPVARYAQEGRRQKALPGRMQPGQRSLPVLLSKKGKSASGRRDLRRRELHMPVGRSCVHRQLREPEKRHKQLRRLWGFLSVGRRQRRRRLCMPVRPNGVRRHVREPGDQLEQLRRLRRRVPIFCASLCVRYRHPCWRSPMLVIAAARIGSGAVGFRPRQGPTVSARSGPAGNVCLGRFRV